MRFRNTENELMWERYMPHSPEQQLQKFNDQSFKYSDKNSAPNVRTRYSMDNQNYDADSSHLYDTDFSEEDEAVVLEFEPEGALEIDDSMDLVPDTDDSNGFGDMMEDEPEEEVDEVLYSDLKKLSEYSERLLKDVDHNELESWMVAKIIKAAEYVSDVWHRLDAKADFANTGHEQADDQDL